ncbi:MAG TPA: hypothetical protein VF885_07585, partial [Arthrobacter sp.]
ITDVQANDPRINWESPLLDFTAAPTFTDFADHLDTVKGREVSWLDPADTVRRLGQAHPSRGLDDCVAYNAETGSDKVLVLVPPSQAADWMRSDDTFDYIEAHFGDEPNTNPVVRELRMGIAPFDGLWMDKWTGIELRKTERFRRLLQSGVASPEELLTAARFIAPVPDFDEYEALASLVLGTPIEKPATGDGPFFKDSGVAAERLVRLVPAEVRELAAFGNLFTSPGTWASLVPVHYTYWT